MFLGEKGRNPMKLIIVLMCRETLGVLDDLSEERGDTLWFCFSELSVVSGHNRSEVHAWC